jgi:hypothetical protein
MHQSALVYSTIIPCASHQLSTSIRRIVKTSVHIANAKAVIIIV